MGYMFTGHYPYYILPIFNSFYCFNFNLLKNCIFTVASLNDHLAAAVFVANVGMILRSYPFELEPCQEVEPWTVKVVSV